MPRPDLTRVPEFFHNYIRQVPEEDLTVAFENNTSSFIQFLNTLPPAKQDYRYAEGKWTIKEILQHIIDAERVFSYRALRFARKDATPLPGFDENLFAENAATERRKWDELVEEFKAVRKSTEILFNSFHSEQLESGGVSGNHPNYVLGMGFICVGHCIHHRNVIKERYLD